MRLTPEKIEALCESHEFFRSGTLTICVLKLTNGAMVVGQSNVIDPTNYIAELGENIALANAREKIWELEGYALKTRGH